VALLDGRPELPTEVVDADAKVGDYIANEVRRLLGEPRLMDGLAGAMRSEVASQQRVDTVVLPALKQLAQLLSD
jgi:hypothetical protein